MAKKIFLFLIMIGLIAFCVKTRAAKIQMGDQKFEGKVVVHQDGSVTTESTAKEVDVEGQGKKRLKLKFKEGRLTVADEQGEEMALEQGGKFKKRSLIRERSAQTGDKKTVTTGTVETQQKTTVTGTVETQKKPTTTKSVKDKKSPVIKTQQKTKTKETTVKKQSSAQEKKTVKKDKTTKTKLVTKKTTKTKPVVPKSNKKTATVEDSGEKITEEIKQ